VDIKQILEYNVSPYILKIYRNFIDECADEFKTQDLDGHSELTDRNTKSDINPSTYIISKARLLFTILKERNNNFIIKEKEYEKVDDFERKNILLAISRGLGSTAQELYEDEDALGRWLDLPALRERLDFQNVAINKKICFLITQYQYAVTNNNYDLNFLLEIVKQDDFTLAGLKTLAALLRAYGNSHPELGSGSKQSIKEILSRVQDDGSSNTNIWISCAYAEILAILEPEQFVAYFKKLFDSPEVSIFLKSAILEFLKYIPDNNALIELAVQDKSAYVRQSVCRYMEHPKALEILRHLILTDPDSAVRSYALVTIVQKIIETRDIEYFISLATEIVALKAGHPELNSGHVIQKQVRDDRLLKTLLQSFKTIAYGGNRHPELDSGSKSTIHEIPKQVRDDGLLIANILISISQGNFLPIIKKQACDVHLEIFIVNDKKLFECKVKLEDIIKNLPLTGEITILDLDINSLLLEEMGKILYLIASNDFDIEFWQHQGNYIIKRAARKKIKLWRILYEFATPSAEKREGFSHAVAKNYKGWNLVLSSMAELSDTGVPGEPLYIADEGPRRFLPPLDYLLSIIKHDQARYIFSSEGITTIAAPANFINKIYAYFSLTFRFKFISDLRNLGDNNNNLFIHTIKEIGIDISFTEDSNIKTCSETKSFFAAFGIFPAFNIFDYFASPNDNNLISLGIFLSLIITFLIFKRIFDYTKYRNTRKLLPLVIGGWGTRGKTATERLKAGLLSGLGFRIISKTTGCKAALIISDPKNKPYELPLIRPYDLHSIAEQKEIAKFAGNSGAEIFLWECMGLNPDYAQLMQLDWMRDDISTITNTYPDHEDTQGPTGEDVASSIAHFIYKKSMILTAEEAMLPILSERAKRAGAELDSVTCIDAGLITEDILQLFPYHEHPSNIALTMLFAKKLGINENVALKSMIDNTIPDIGSLKYFIPFRIKNKEIHFINGMSANEVASAIGNWQTLGFDKMTPEHNPNIYVSALVNNRADRQKRSTEFAKIMVNEFSVDKYYLIGTNLDGFKKIILKRWYRYLDNIIFRIKTGQPIRVLEETAMHLRIPMDKDETNKRLSAVNLTGDSDEIKQGVEFKRSLEEDYINYSEIKAKINDGSLPERDLRKFFTDIFAKKIIIIDEKQSAPSEILRIIISSTPPAFVNKVMGMQNIKSPGIEFINAWYDYEVRNVQFTLEPKEDSKSDTGLLSALLNLKQDFQNTRKARQIYKDLENSKISLGRAQNELNKIDAVNKPI
jgi:poly-gamma-glutamate synthase PgsB/CapB